MKTFIDYIFPRRSLSTDLLFWLETITVSSMLVVGIVFYLVSSFQTKQSLIKQSRKTADQIASVLKPPLYNLDNESIRNSAHIFLSSENICGLTVYSEVDGILIKTPAKTESVIPSIKKEIYWDNILLGFVTVDFSDKSIKSYQKTTISIILMSLFVILLINVFLITLMTHKTIQTPLENIREKVQKIAQGDFGGTLEKSPMEDLNAIIQSVNHMSISLKEQTDFLKESEERYRQIFDTSFVAFLIHKPDSSIVDVNNTMLDMYGLPSKEKALEFSVQDGLSADQNPFEQIPRWFEETISGNPQTFPWLARRPLTGEIFDVQVSLKPLTLANKTFVLASVLDMSEQKETERKLIQAQKMEAIGSLAGGLAHDFNNVLMGISGSLSLIQFLFKDGQQISLEELKEYLDTIDHATTRASGMVQQLLALSRKQDLKMTAVDLNNTIKNVVKIANASFDKSIEIHLNLPNHPTFTFGDPTQLEQILLNICVNASHAMTIMRPPNETWGGLLEIKIEPFENSTYFKNNHTSADHDSYWHIIIKDTGVGISKETIQKIFNPFFTTKEKGEGTGLGLSMVYNLIRSHKGFVDAYSEPKRGTIFHLYFPKYTEKQDNKNSHKEKNTFHMQGTILLIDDEIMIRQIGRKMLEEIGYTVLEAQDGEEGIRIFKEHAPEITAILLDLVMPKLSGKQTFNQLRKLDPNVKIILSSGFGQDERVRKILDLGAIGFIAKPYTIEKLRSVFQDLFNANGQKPPSGQV